MTALTLNKEINEDKPKPQDEKFRRQPSSSSSMADKGKVKGMQLSKSKKTEDFFTAINKEEKLQAPSLGAAAAAAAPQEQKKNVHVLVEEKLAVVFDREGGLQSMVVNGEMKLCVYDPDDSKIIIRTSGLKESDGFKCRLHPKINKNLWTKDNALGLQDAGKGFPVGSDNAPVVLKWSKKASESDVPFTLVFWPNVEHGQTVVNVEYNMEKPLTLKNIMITIPCPSSEPPEVRNCDGDFKYDQKSKVLTWSIAEVTPDNKTGSFEFGVPELDADSFYPININFSSLQTLSGLRVESVVNTDDSQLHEYTADYTLGVEKYTIKQDDQ